jgi:2-C-methyl-D-erythritol 4-phosphate cytidylyltransferase
VIAANSHGVNVVALIPADSRGVPLGAEMPQGLAPVGGESLLLRAVRGLLDSACVRHVVVSASASDMNAVRSELAPLGASISVVRGGLDRFESVRRAFDEAIRAVADAEVVLVHDAARAFTPVSVIREVVRAVEDGARAVVPVLPVPDTIKQVDAAGEVSATVDRSGLRAVQTPQGFAVDALREALAGGKGSDSDDLGLVERLGMPVRTVPGHPHALKITTPFDLAVAGAVLAIEATTGGDHP